MKYLILLFIITQKESEMPIFNVMEHMVDAKLKELLPKSNCCTCEKCTDDIRALALNRLPAKYVSSDMGELYARAYTTMEMQNSLDINFAVYSAIDFVTSHPHHDTPKE